MTELKCEICGKQTATVGGLALHKKVYHQQTKEVEKPKSAKAPKQSKPKKPKTKEKTIDKVKKDKLKAVKETEKNFKQTPTDVNHNDKVSKSILKKIFPKVMKSRVVGYKEDQPIHKHLENSYRAIVLSNKNGWKRVRLVGSETMICWAEGKIGNKYRVTRPAVGKK